jgi:hypothetical protein
MRRLISLPRTLKLLIRSWEEVEALVRDQIAQEFKVHDEVFINRYFYGKLSTRFRKANEDEVFSHAVLEDLQELATTKDLRDDARRVSAGIIARVSYHEPHIEARTGGDLGFTVARPSFEIAEGRKGFRSLLHEQGLLCQAKRQTKNKKWGSFTEKQRQVLPEHIAYLCLLLYGYSDEHRHDLRPFMWKPCEGMLLDKIEGWLASGDIADTIGSGKILHALGNGELGTDREDILKDVVCSGTTAHLKVEVNWIQGPPPPPDDGEPLPTEGLLKKLKQEKFTMIQQQQVLARQRAQVKRRQMRH